MPGAAWKLGAAAEMQSLEHIAARLLELARQPVASAVRAASR